VGLAPWPTWLFPTAQEDGDTYFAGASHCTTGARELSRYDTAAITEAMPIAGPRPAVRAPIASVIVIGDHKQQGRKLARGRRDSA
jgi:hypothetical protein